MALLPAKFQLVRCWLSICHDMCCLLSFAWFSYVFFTFLYKKVMACTKIEMFIFILTSIVVSYQLDSHSMKAMNWAGALCPQHRWHCNCVSKSDLPVSTHDTSSKSDLNSLMQKMIVLWTLTIIIQFIYIQSKVKNEWK